MSNVFGSSKLGEGLRRITDPLDLFTSPPTKDTATATLPTIAEPPTMPVPGDETATRARRRSLIAQSRRRGRASTMLSESVTSEDKLGG